MGVVFIHSLELFNCHRCFFSFFVCIGASNVCLVFVGEGGILLF